MRIEAQLRAAGWAVQDRSAINLYAGRGVAIREFLLQGNDEVDLALLVPA